MRRCIEVAVVVLVIIQNVNSIPQFGQSFSSSSITDSSGKVLSKSVYTDSTGKKIIDGVPQLDVDLLPPFLPNQIPGLDLPVPSPFNKPVVVLPSIDVQPPLLPTDTRRNLAPTTVKVTTTARPTTVKVTTTARPTTVRVTSTSATQRPTTTTTVRTTRAFLAPKFAPAVNNFVRPSFDGKETGSYKSNVNDGSYKIRDDQNGSYRFKGLDDGSYRSNGNDGKYRDNGKDGKYRAYGNDGTYRPSGNLGTYVHNNAGKYVHDDRGKYRGI